MSISSLLTDQLATALPQGARRAVERAVETYGQATGRWRLRPEYLLIGAQRSGTTSLYRYLADHPGVAPVTFLRKEIQFFSLHYWRSVDWYWGHFPTRLFTRLAERRTGRRLLTGEASPYYIFHPLAAHRVAEVLPDMKIVAMLRDPVERAFSHYQHMRRLGKESLSFEEAISVEPERLHGEEERILADARYQPYRHVHFSYVSRGRYAEQLQRWLSFFPRENILILSSEEFFSDPDPIFRSVLSFIGLPDWSRGSYEIRNATERAEMAPNTRARLRELYDEPNRRLYELVGRDFGW